MGVVIAKEKGEENGKEPPNIGKRRRPGVGPEGGAFRPRGELTDRNMRGNGRELRQDEVALLIRHPEELKYILKDLEEKKENSKFYGISLALHFSSSDVPTLYVYGDVLMPKARKNVLHEGYMPTVQLYMLKEALENGWIKQLELHLPDHETLLNQIIQVTPCNIEHHRILWDRYLFLRNFFSDVKGKVIITENGGFIKRDGKRTAANGSELTREAAVLAELRYRAGLRGFEDWFSQPPKRFLYFWRTAEDEEVGEVRHAFEIMPGDTVASESITLPREQIVCSSMHGSPLTDIAHLQLSEIYAFDGIGEEFRAYLDGLQSIVKSDPRYTDMSDLKELLETRGFALEAKWAIASITRLGERLADHLELLKELPDNAQPEGLKGVAALIYWVGAAKKLAGTDRDNVVPALHAVCARRTYDEIKNMEDVRAIVNIFKNDLPLVYVLNSDVHGLTQALLQENGGTMDRATAYELAVKLIREGLEALKAIFEDSPEVPKLVVDEGRYSEPLGPHRTRMERRIEYRMEGLDVLRNAISTIDFNQALEDFNLEHPVKDAA